MAEVDLKELEEIWESAPFAKNLRHLSIFLNRLRFVCRAIGKEVYLPDLIRLEIVRTLNRDWYEVLFDNAEYFFESNLAFEAISARLSIDNEETKKRRAAKYEELRVAHPKNSVEILQLLSKMFPAVDVFVREKFPFAGWGFANTTDAEMLRRIVHPRYFRQYFLFGVPDELYSENEIARFVSLVPNDEEAAAKYFEGEFNHLRDQDFKRWHFMHKLELRIANFELKSASGLCVGMARVSGIWTADAFELFAAIRCAILTALRLSDMEPFFLTLITESPSETYSFSLLRQFQVSDADERLKKFNTAALTKSMHSRLRKKYLESNVSIFNERQGIEPIRTLFDWKRLSESGSEEVRDYLTKELSTNLESLRKFFQSMFRVDFIDDYAALRQLIPYEELDKIIDRKMDLIKDEPNVSKYLSVRSAEAAATKTLPIDDIESQ